MRWNTQCSKNYNNLVKNKKDEMKRTCMYENNITKPIILHAKLKKY